ncbi:MAG: ATP-binding protein, partial [Candidatus Saccharibacteria bacterium]|nr:ATP-binding protein [Candidatus Saccharibacteria bacterium]
MNREDIKRDEYLRKLAMLRGTSVIKIITGIRRVGKSYLLDPLFSSFLKIDGVAADHIIKVDFDTEDGKRLIPEGEFIKYLNSKLRDEKTYYIILDEVQKLENFVEVLNELLKRHNLDIYITGSNSKFLSSDIVTEFRGRGIEIRVWPLSFKEISAYRLEEKQQLWQDYLRYGGLPQVVLQENREIKQQLLDNLSGNAYVNDVVERHDLKHNEELVDLMHILASAMGSLTNPSKLERSFKSSARINLSRKKIVEYIDYLEDAFIIEKASRYDVRGKHYLETPQKYYFSDVGIRNSLINYRQNEETHIMENILYCDLRRRGFTVDVGVVPVRQDGMRK